MCKSTIPRYHPLASGFTEIAQRLEQTNLRNCQGRWKFSKPPTPAAPPVDTNSGYSITQRVSWRIESVCISRDAIWISGGIHLTNWNIRPKPSCSKLRAFVPLVSNTEWSQEKYSTFLSKADEEQEWWEVTDASLLVGMTGLRKYWGFFAHGPIRGTLTCWFRWQYFSVHIWLFYRQAWSVTIATSIKNTSMNGFLFIYRY